MTKVEDTPCSSGGLSRAHRRMNKSLYWEEVEDEGGRCSLWLKLA